MRTIIDIPENMVALVNYMCEQRKVSRAELIRKAIKFYCDHNLAKTGEENLAFGIWKDKTKNGMTYQDELRAEW